MKKIDPSRSGPPNLSSERLDSTPGGSRTTIGRGGSGVREPSGGKMRSVGRARPSSGIFEGPGATVVPTPGDARPTAGEIVRAALAPVPEGALDGVTVRLKNPKVPGPNPRATSNVRLDGDEAAGRGAASRGVSGLGVEAAAREDRSAKTGMAMTAQSVGSKPNRRASSSAGATQVARASGSGAEDVMALDLRTASAADLAAALAPIAVGVELATWNEDRLRTGVELARLFRDQGAEAVQAILPLVAHPAATIGRQGVDNLRHVNLVFRNASREETTVAGELRELAASLGTDLLGKGSTQGLPIARFEPVSPEAAVRAMALPDGLAKQPPAQVASLLAKVGPREGKLGELAEQFRRLTSGALTVQDTLQLTRQQTIDRALVDAPAPVKSVLEPVLGKLKNGELDLGGVFAELGMAKSPDASKYFQARIMTTQAFLRFLPPLEGTFAHNYTDPSVTFELGRALGLSRADAVEAAAEQTMHGFGNAFVAAGYPGLPDFASVRFTDRESSGAKVELGFTGKQLAHLNAVGRASLAFHQNFELPPDVVAAHPEWGFGELLPPRGFQALGMAAISQNGGTVPASLRAYVASTPEARALKDARIDAGRLANQTNADNDANFAGAAMGKWLGIIKGTLPNAAEARLGDVLLGKPGGHQGVTWPANMYRTEQAILSPEGTGPFDLLFSASARALGLYLPKDDRGYVSILERTEEGTFRVRGDAPEDAVKAAAAALPNGGPADPKERLAAFYSKKLDEPWEGRPAYEVLVTVGAAGVDLDGPLA